MEQEHIKANWNANSQYSETINFKLVITNSVLQYKMAQSDLNSFFFFLNIIFGLSGMV